MRNKKTIILLFVIVSILFFIYLCIPYVMVNKLTKKYGSEFEELYTENGFYDDIEYLKVFQYRNEKVNIYMDNNIRQQKLYNLSDDYAVVLYIEKNHSSASVFIFYDENGRWKLLSWDTIWSFSGSADGFMWPYYF